MCDLISLSTAIAVEIKSITSQNVSWLSCLMKSLLHIQLHVMYVRPKNINMGVVWDENHKPWNQWCAVGWNILECSDWNATAQ